MNKRLFIRATITAVLIWVVTALYTGIKQAGIMDYQYSGFPLVVKEGGGMCINGPCATSYNFLNLGINTAVYFAIGLIISFVTLRKSNKNR